MITKNNAIAIILNLIGLCLLFIAIYLSPAKLLYDEPHHIAIAKGIEAKGLIDTMEHPPSVSALGPLYSFIHLGLAPLTRLKAPTIRLINFTIISLIMVLTVLIAQIMKLSNPVLTASTLLVIPIIYPSIGMALTEVPALLFFTLFNLFFLNLMSNIINRSLSSIITLSIFAGFSLGLACLGRQIYICALFPTLLILSKDRNTWIAFFIVVFFTIISSCWLFLLWGGLTPPGLRIGGISIIHGIFSFAYLGIATWFVCPNWLKINKSSMMLSLCVAGIIMIFTVSNYEPATSLAHKIMPGWLLPYYGRLSIFALAIIAVVTIYSFVTNGMIIRNDKKMLFCYILIFILALTPIGISFQFSGRYVMAGIILLILILRPNLEIGFYSLTRFLFGILIGIASLETYYYH